VPKPARPGRNSGQSNFPVRKKIRGRSPPRSPSLQRGRSPAQSYARSQSSCGDDHGTSGKEEAPSFLGNNFEHPPMLNSAGSRSAAMGANARDGARWRSGDGGRTRRCSWPDTSKKISMRRSPEKHFEKFGEDGEEADKNKNKAALPLPPRG
jgi:hypothetical protein